MHSSFLLSGLFAAAAIAAPLNAKRDVVVHTVVEVAHAVVTDIVIVGPNGQPISNQQIASFDDQDHDSHPVAPIPTPTPAPAPAAPMPTPKPAAQAPASTPKPAAQAPASTPKPAPAPAPSSPAPSTGSNDGSPMVDGASILSQANKWRSAYGLSTLTWSASLTANAKKTGQDDKGQNEIHELNPGSFAQVIAPGLPTSAGRDNAGLTGFELAYVAGWLCERASSPALAGKCPTYTKKAGMDLSSGETGHADILTSTKYKQIGCFFAANPTPATQQWTGLWVCDLA